MKVKNGYLVDKLSDLFRTGIPELDKNLDEMFNFSQEIEEEIRMVYVIGFEDGVIKIGISKNPMRRMKSIELQSGRHVSEYRFSNALPKMKALEIEALMKKVLEPYHLNGEFYKISYKKAVGLLDYYENGD